MNEEILAAIAERDEAITARFADMETKNAELAAKNALMGDQLQEMEQKGLTWFNDRKPQPEFSVQRIIKHLSNPRDNPLDGFEAETHQELAEKSGLALDGAVLIPLQLKATVVGPLSPDLGGSSMIETELHSELIDVLREESIVMSLNPTMILAGGDLDLPRKAAGTTAYWFGADDGDSITESTPTFDTVQLRPKFVAGLTKVSYKMMTQTGGSIENILRRDLVEVIAEEIDRAAIQGTGSSSQPTGILNQAGILADTWTGSPSTLLWDDVLEMEKLLADNKALKGNLAALCDPATFKTTKSTLKSTSSAGAGFLAEQDGTMNGYPLRATTNMPANTILSGNWNSLVVANWGVMALDIDRSTDFAKGTIGIRAILPIDFGVRHAASFVKSSIS